MLKKNTKKISELVEEPNQKLYIYIYIFYYYCYYKYVYIKIKKENKHFTFVVSKQV